LRLEVFAKLGKNTASVNTGDVIHHESLTKKGTFPKDEVTYIYQRYGALLKDTRWYSKKILRWSEPPRLALPFEPNYAVQWVNRCWA